MRVFLAVLSLWFAHSQPALAQSSDTSAPAMWEPAYWDKMMAAVKDAKQRGDKTDAEKLCSRAIPYVEAQAVKALRQHADFLEAQKSPSAADARAKAERFAQIKAEQARGNGPGSTYLGFAPWEQLDVYASALQQSHRDSDAQAMHLLAAAYRYSQEVYVRRSILMGEHKDPRGEC